jgi:hypothetical protein
VSAEDVQIMQETIETLAMQLAVLSERDVMASLSDEEKEVVSDLLVDLEARRRRVDEHKESRREHLRLLKSAADTGQPLWTRPEPGNPRRDVEPEPDAP